MRSNNGVIRESTQFTLRKVGEIKDIGDTILPSRRKIPGSSSNGSSSAKKPATTNSAGGSGSGSSASGTPAQKASNRVVNSTEDTVTKVVTVRGIPRTVTVPILNNTPETEKSTGGVEFIDPKYDVTQPAVMRASYGKSKDDVVEELSEAEWAARTSIRGDAIGVIDVSNAGPTKVIKSRKGGTLNKPLFS
jgi:hypothetical protein